MRRLSKRERILIIGTLILALATLFLYYYYFPLTQKNSDMQKKSEELTEQINESMTVKILLDNAKLNLDKLRLETSDNKEYLMETIDEPGILVYISDIINDISMDQTIKYQEVLDSVEYVSKDINLTFRTSYDELFQILKKFEEGDNYTTLNSISIKMDEITEISNVDEENLDVPINEDSDEDNLIASEDEMNMPLSVEYSLRFYGKESNWAGTGQYDFMKNGSFRKNNIFE